MKTTNFNKDERLLSFNEFSEELGISLEELIKIAFENGIINADGTPTEFAISEGLLTEVRHPMTLV